MSSIQSYIQENQARFLDELFVLLRTPSISSLKPHAPDMHRCAEQLVEALITAGADKAQVYPTTGHPVVYGEKTIDPSLPTVLIYGHYDVQPVDPLNLWDSPPFEPEVRNGAIYARGANDDKGQLFMHIKALEYLLLHKKLRCNLKFLFE